MPPQNQLLLSANIVLAAAALMAVLLVLGTYAYVRYTRYVSSLPRRMRSQSFAPFVVSILPPTAYLMAVIVGVEFFPDIWQRVVEDLYLVFIFCALILCALVMGVQSIWVRVRRRGDSAPKLTSTESYSFMGLLSTSTALFSFFIALVLLFSVLMLAVPVMADVQIADNDNAENLEYARALFIVVPVMMTHGSGWLCASVFFESLSRPAFSKE